MLKLYNTASSRLEEFKPLGEVVKIYTCGPTVYAEAHIGNLTAFIYWDLLVRTLRADGYGVKRVLNLTDVGHLTSDADFGEDKLEKGAAREGLTVWEVADRYIEKFMRDYHSLDLTEPEVLARATDYIAEDIEAVDLMSANGFAYETTDGVYYDTAKFSKYADFAKLDLAGLQAGARVEFSEEKRGVADFAVWKFIQPGEKHAMRWDYLGRPGYPGWHLECCSIIHKELGEPIDIHTGGIDHIPVHHTNEIAECFAAYGRELARYWLHCNFITIDGQKISKSLGNVYALDDLYEREFSAMDYKMWVLSGHYQGTRNFTFESLEGAKARRLSWRNRIAECRQREVVGDSDVAGDSEVVGDARERVLEAVNNNLNSAEAFAVIDNAELSLADWEFVDELFGLKLMADTPVIAEELTALVSEREKARGRRDFARADEIRDELAQHNITVKDTPEGPVWQYLK